MFYNTAFFWKSAPEALRHAPFSIVLEMAEEAARINDELEERNKNG